MATYNSGALLNLGAVPLVASAELYTELLDIHDALEALSDFIARLVAITDEINGNYNVQAADGTVRIGAQAISSITKLPSRQTTTLGYKYIIKRIDTNAANVVIVTTSDGDLIDGVTSKTLLPLASITVQSNGTNGWDII